MSSCPVFLYCLAWDSGHTFISRSIQSHPSIRKGASSNYRQPMTLQLFLLAIRVALNCQTNPFSNMTKFNRNKVKQENLHGRSLDFLNRGGIQRGSSPLASGHVAVEQKSNVSAIYCPTSNIACSEPRTLLKRRKLVRKELQLIYRESTEEFTESLTNVYQQSIYRLLTVYPKFMINLRKVY